MTKPKQIFSSILLILLFTAPGYAQSSRFNAGLIAGLNFAELEAQSRSGYLGLNTGLLGTCRLGMHGQLGLEILFSQNGEYLLPDFYPAVQYGKIRLNHLEIPLHFDWLIGSTQSPGFHPWNINVGLAYTLLLSYYAETLDGIDITDQILYAKAEAFLFQTGLSYHFTRHLGLNCRASLPVRNQGLNWTLSARLIYLLA